MKNFGAACHARRSSGRRGLAGIIIASSLLACLIGFQPCLQFLAPKGYTTSGARVSGAPGMFQGHRRHNSLVARAAEEGDGQDGFKVGDTVEAVFPDDGEWYPGVVEKDNGDASYVVKWDDPDGGPETSVVKAEDMNRFTPKTPLDQLKIGEKVKGRVVSVREFGAFVDIGAVREGLVHISKQPKPEVKSGPYEVDDTVEAVFPDDGEWYPGVVTKVSKDSIEVKWDDPDGGPETSECKPDDVQHAASGGMEVDQEVEVWIDRVFQSDDGDKLALSMLPPPDLGRFALLHPQEWLRGTIVSIKQFGFFVEVEHPDGGAPEQGLVHVSQIKAGRVEDPWAEAEEGQEVQVRVVDVDEDRGRLALSMVDGGMF
eukprot:TRINITY_DN80883_c0_g1_i1.p1 TRINITY_DN80883_c0_g1~~TRINITY_DN80883_c0_g1_i1.p1  ORF type:complete len:371 (-),score=71.54 TRINITY_DN80883_c0_g1_i1:170-1282(-)